MDLGADGWQTFRFITLPNLATALVRLHREPGLRSRLGQAARATVLQNYTWEAVGHRILRLAALDPEHRESATVRASALALPGAAVAGR